MQIWATLCRTLLILDSEFRFSKAYNKLETPSIGSNELTIYIYSGKQSERHSKFSSAKLFVTEADLFRCVFNAIWYILHLLYPLKMLRWTQNILTWKTIHWLILLIQRIFLKDLIFVLTSLFIFFNLKYFTKDFVSVQYPTESLAPKKQAVSHRGTISLKINTVLSLTLVIKADG